MRNKITKTYYSRSQLGLSYIEVLISLFVLTVALTLLHSAHNFLLLNRVAQHREIALKIVQSQMEELRNTPYDSLPSSGNFNSAFLSSIPQGNASMTLSNYNDSTKQVEVTVTWKEPNSAVIQNVSLTTLMTESGL